MDEQDSCVIATGRWLRAMSMVPYFESSKNKYFNETDQNSGREISLQTHTERNFHVDFKLISELLCIKCSIQQDS